jgi:hypothetical protein
MACNFACIFIYYIIEFKKKFDFTLIIMILSRYRCRPDTVPLQSPVTDRYRFFKRLQTVTLR